MATYEDFINEQAGIDRNRRIAEMLMQQGSQPLETNQVAGGYVVPVSPLSAINKIAQQLSGAYIGRKASDRESALTNEKLAAFKDIDFSDPNVANKIAQIDPSKGMDYALKMAEARMPKTATPGLGYIPAGYKAITNEFGEFFQGPEGDLIANRFGPTAYQQYQTNPERRAAVERAIAGARGEEKPIEYTDIEGRQDVAPARVFPGYNPGNIRPEGQTQGFQSYATPEEGLKAIDDNLKSYGTKHGINTISGVINRWSPSNENDTEQLIANASQRLGIDPNQEIDLTDPVQRQAVATAITMQENPIFGRGVRPQSKAEALTTEENIKNKSKIQQAELKKEKSAENMLKLTSQPYDGKTIDEWINQATGSGTGALIDRLAASQGIATKGAIANEKLKTIQGWLVANVPRMEGPQSDFDVKNYQQMASNIGDPNVPAEIKKSSFKTMKEIMTKYSGKDNTVDDKSARINALKQRHGLQ